MNALYESPSCHAQGCLKVARSEETKSWIAYGGMLHRSPANQLQAYSRRVLNSTGEKSGSPADR